MFLFLSTTFLSICLFNDSNNRQDAMAWKIFTINTEIHCIILHNLNLLRETFSTRFKNKTEMKTNRVEVIFVLFEKKIGKNSSVTISWGEKSFNGFWFENPANFCKNEQKINKNDDKVLWFSLCDGNTEKVLSDVLHTWQWALYSQQFADRWQTESHLRNN